MIHQTTIRFTFLPARKCEQLRKIKLSGKSIRNKIAIIKIEGFAMGKPITEPMQNVTVTLTHRGMQMPNELHITNFALVKTYMERAPVINLYFADVHGIYVSNYQPILVHKELISLSNMYSMLEEAAVEEQNTHEADKYHKNVTAIKHATRILAKYFPKP